MELRKSYRGFVIWMLFFVAGLVGMMLLPVENGGLLTRGIIVYTAAALALLALIVWRTEQVYWYNGTEYEDAVEAGSERRKRFAWRHFRIFGGFALGLLVFCAVMQLMGWPWWIDIVVGTVGLCAAAFSTMPIRL
ncbi:MAG: hypothetical protein IJ343_14435 [Clostridia bacterium]|nr:hypothetical protein [Clostridia bacterium]